MLPSEGNHSSIKGLKALEKSEVCLKEQKVTGQPIVGEMTPMLRQYYGLKSQCPDAILFFRMGDFYEIFGGDAEIVAPLLDIVLTSRDKGGSDRGMSSDASQPNGNKIPFCGVPHHSARNYWLRLLKRGMKVAIADQVEDPAQAKGLVKRDIVRIYSPGLIDDLEGLDLESPNYLMAIVEQPIPEGNWILVVVDVSTGELRLGSLPNFNDVLDFIKVTSPKEILVRKFFAIEMKSHLSKVYGDLRPLVGELPETILRDEQSQKIIITRIFGSGETSDSLEKSVKGAQGSLAALLVYLENLKVPLTGLMRISPLSEPESMILDDTAIRDLELFETTRRRQTEGSLFRALNQTLTPMGARLLRKSLLQPMLSQNLIEKRLNVVQSLVNLGERGLAEIRLAIKGCPDIERLGIRVANRVASPVDLGRLRQALGQSKGMLESLEPLLQGQPLGDQEAIRSIECDIQSGFEVLELLSNALEDQPGPLGLGRGVFKADYDVDLDKKRHFVFAGEGLILQYQERLKEQTGITSLKIKLQKNYGHLIEITKSHSSKVPSAFIKRQTMVNAERYTTPELQELSENIQNSQEHLVLREREIFEELIVKVTQYVRAIKTSSESLAQIDLLLSFAWQAIKYQYSRPRWTNNGGMVLKGSRHPVVETFVGQHDFFANDIAIEGRVRQLLITGPNMAGKSTLMRQVALTALMAQIGSFVPARSAELPIFDRIFTRVGASDDLVKGQSTFMVEMSEAATILKNASKRSLVILDEVGRGTSTQDGLALAAAILTDLAQRITCIALFATHYHELVAFSAPLRSVQSVQTEVIERGDEIVFSHRLKPGATSSSYGIEVARIAGIPPLVLEHAKKIAGEVHKIDSGIQKSDGDPKKAVELPEVKEVKQSKYGKAVKNNRELLPLEDRGELQLMHHEPTAFETDWIERVKGLNIYRTTPLQALNILAELQASLKPVLRAPPDEVAWSTT